MNSRKAQQIARIEKNSTFIQAIAKWVIGFPLFCIISGLATAASSTWTQLAPTGGPPATRELLVSVYDAATNRLIIHGGIGPRCCTILSDAWVLTNADGTENTTSRWIKLTPQAALNRARHTAVYNSVSNRMIIFGGQDEDGISGNIFNEVWILEHANGQGGTPRWVQLNTVGDAPLPRVHATAVYDAASNRMTVFGGDSNIGFFNDSWVLTNADGTDTAPSEWVKLSPSGTPPSARTGATSVYDNDTNRMIIFGGWPRLNDTWILTHANGLGGSPEWIKASPTGAPPAPRFSPAVGYDSLNKRMMIFGGTDLTTSFSDTWVLTKANAIESASHSQWIKLEPLGTKPKGRSQLGAVYSPLKNRLTIFAGDTNPNCCSFLNDVWVLSSANGISDNIFFASLSDINNDSSPEIAAVTYDAAIPKTTATIKNAQTGVLVKQFNFNGQFAPKRVATLPDLNANGAQEIAVLGIRSSDQAVQVEIRDSLSGVQLSTVPFPATFPPIALSVLRDRGCASQVCLAVLQQNDTALRVQLKDALSGTAIRNIPFSDGYNGKALGSIADLNGNKKREFVLLADAKTPGADYQLEIRDSQSGTLIRTIVYPAGEAVRGLLNLADLNLNGGTDLASLLPHIPQVTVLDTKTGSTLNTITTTLAKPFLMSRETDTASDNQVALFGVRSSDGKNIAEVYDSLTGAIVHSIEFSSLGTTVGFRRIGDLNGNGSSELVRLREQTGVPQFAAEIRDGATGALINTIGF